MKSYFIDTNYFLRLLIKDDKKQYVKTYRIFQQATTGKTKLFTSIIVFFEIYWVLSSFYKKNKKNCINLLNKILKMDFLEIENKPILKASLSLFTNYPIDLEDCYNIALFKLSNLSTFATFDKKIIKILK